MSAAWGPRVPVVQGMEPRGRQMLRAGPYRARADRGADGVPAGGAGAVHVAPRDPPAPATREARSGRGTVELARHGLYDPGGQAGVAGGTSGARDAGQATAGRAGRAPKRCRCLWPPRVAGRRARGSWDEGAGCEDDENHEDGRCDDDNENNAESTHGGGAGNKRAGRGGNSPQAPNPALPPPPGTPGRAGGKAGAGARFRGRGSGPGLVRHRTRAGKGAHRAGIPGGPGLPPTSGPTTPRGGNTAVRGRGRGAKGPRRLPIPRPSGHTAPGGYTGDAESSPPPQNGTAGHGRRMTVGWAAREGLGRARDRARGTPTPREEYAAAPA